MKLALSAFASIAILFAVLTAILANAGPLDRMSPGPRVNPAADKMLRVPGVVGMRVEDALVVLQQAGLNPVKKIIKKEDPRYDGMEGTVVAQNPLPGGVAMLGSSVSVIYYMPDKQGDTGVPSGGWSGGSYGSAPEPAGWGGGYGGNMPGDSGSGGYIPGDVFGGAPSPMDGGITETPSSDEAGPEASGADGSLKHKEGIVDLLKERQSGIGAPGDDDDGLSPQGKDASDGLAVGTLSGGDDSPTGNDGKAGEEGSEGSGGRLMEFDPPVKDKAMDLKSSEKITDPRPVRLQQPVWGQSGKDASGK